MDFLQVKNGKIVDQSGTEVYLRGTCVGGWMNMEDFINRLPWHRKRYETGVCKSNGGRKVRIVF